MPQSISSDEDVISLLKQGAISAFNSRRAADQHPPLHLGKLDASNVHFVKIWPADLCFPADYANLSGCDLTGVEHIEQIYQLHQLPLRGAKLSDKQMIALLTAGKIDAFNHYRAQNPAAVPDLRGFDAAGKNLANLNLSGCDLTGVEHIERATNLQKATLNGARVTDSQNLRIQQFYPNFSFAAQGAIVEKTPRTQAEIFNDIKAKRNARLAHSNLRRAAHVAISDPDTSAVTR